MEYQSPVKNFAWLWNQEETKVMLNTTFIRVSTALVQKVKLRESRVWSHAVWCMSKRCCLCYIPTDGVKSCTKRFDESALSECIINFTLRNTFLEIWSFIKGRQLSGHHVHSNWPVWNLILTHHSCKRNLQIDNLPMEYVVILTLLSVVKTILLIQNSI